jgi:hypothetical protein
MHQRIVSANNFYDNPSVIRAQALSVEYKDNLSIDSFITNESIDKLSYLVNANVEPVEDLPSGHFKQTHKNSKFISIDACPSADWIAVVYLTLPVQAEGESALSLYRHAKNGSEAIPTSTEMTLQGFNNLLEVKESYVGIDGCNLSAWQSWFTVYQRWNRVVLFDACSWHRELEGFGDTINNCRLSQLFYLRNK